MYGLPFERLELSGWLREPVDAPALYRMSFDLTEPADTFLDVGELHKGALWVNGHNAGRFWRIGPQRSLYVPGVWLRAGSNEIVALDVFGHASFPAVCGRTDPVML